MSHKEPTTNEVSSFMQEVISACIHQQKKREVVPGKKDFTYSCSLRNATDFHIKLYHNDELIGYYTNTNLFRISKEILTKVIELG